LNVTSTSAELASILDERLLPSRKQPVQDSLVRVSAAHVYTGTVRSFVPPGLFRLHDRRPERIASALERTKRIYAAPPFQKKHAIEVLLLLETDTTDKSKIDVLAVCIEKLGPVE
jgi:hypothetical protein